ncbi:FkbM family methyltransferase [Nocardioides sp. SYSU D00038]|uniref:FkbM family methyltransferase n=1 Tax=Nocardioides sp. SYSU D00038 TaxID=2812554 RepID=UPI0019681BA5|nr:FkbM family methyltransferase [Nocardioides sp. SYSU D00038]
MPELSATTASGRVIHVDPADERGRRLVAANGDLNPGSRRLWQRALAAHAWDLVVDVGANYGEMLVGVDLPPAARVVAFEPQPVVRGLLERTLVDNDLDVEVRPEVLAREAGTASFAVDLAWSGQSAIAAPGDGDHPERYGLATVPATTLDQLLGDELDGAGSFCVKVDVEGFEADVLAGGAAALARTDRWVLMIEVLHLPASYVADLALRHTVLLLDERTGGLVQVPGGNAELVRRLRDGRWLYGQDCLVAGATGAAWLLDAATSRLG